MFTNSGRGADINALVAADDALHGDEIEGRHQHGIRIIITKQ
jgi:hypothetical protein